VVVVVVVMKNALWVDFVCAPGIFVRSGRNDGALYVEKKCAPGGMFAIQ